MSLASLMHQNRLKKREVFCLSIMNQQEGGQQKCEMNFYENAGHQNLVSLLPGLSLQLFFLYLCFLLLVGTIKKKQ